MDALFVNFQRGIELVDAAVALNGQTLLQTDRFAKRCGRKLETQAQRSRRGAAGY
jgi:hypothetical protein